MAASSSRLEMKDAKLALFELVFLEEALGLVCRHIRNPEMKASGQLGVFLCTLHTASGSAPGCETEESLNPLFQAK